MCSYYLDCNIEKVLVNKSAFCDLKTYDSVTYPFYTFLRSKQKEQTYTTHTKTQSIYSMIYLSQK